MKKTLYSIFALVAVAGLAAAAGEEALESLTEQGLQVFLDFAESILPQSVLRAAITSAYRRPENEMVPMLLEQAHSVFQTTKKFESKNVYNLLYKDELTKMNHQIEYLEKEKARLQNEAEQHTATIKQLREQSSLKTVSNA